MGAPMARNLLKAGHDVALWSHFAGKMPISSRPESGGKWRLARDPGRSGSARLECVFLCVGDSAMSETVILGPSGTEGGGLKACLIVVDSASTVSPASSRHTHEELGKAGIDFLGAPCTGSTAGRRSVGTLNLHGLWRGSSRL